MTGTVADYKKYLVKPSAGLLEPDEPILAGAPCLPRGAITKRAVGSIFGVVGNLVAGDAATRGHKLAGSTLPSVIALGVTPKRLLVFAMGPVTGRPNQLLFAIPLSDVTEVRWAQGRAVGMKKMSLDISLADGSDVNLDIAREHMRHGRKVQEALVGLGVPQRPDTDYPALSKRGRRQQP